MSQPKLDQDTDSLCKPDPPIAAVPAGVEPRADGPAVYVRLRRDIDRLDREIGGRPVLVLHDQQTGKFFHLGSDEAKVVCWMDGNSTLAEIAVHLQHSGLQWSTEDVQAWAMMLVKSGLAVLSDAEGKELALPGGESGAAPQPSAASVLKRFAGPLAKIVSQRIVIGNADPVASLACPYLGRLFSPTGVVVGATLAVAAGMVMLAHKQPLGDELRSMFSPAAWPLMVVIWFVLKIIHEMGHAACAKRKGVRAGDCGIMFFMFAPLAYVDVTDAWRLRNRWSRVQIAMAGVYLEAWTAVAAVFAFATLPDGLARHMAAQWIMIAGPATWMVNANPLLRLDGYYALSDALNIPNLRMHGRSHWVAIVERWLLGIPAPARLLVGWRSQAATIHAAASIVFQLTWMTGLVIAVSRWAGALGMILAISATLLWGIVPLAAWSMRHWQASGDAAAGGRAYRRRLVVVAGLAVVVALILVSVSNPFVRGVPVVVQYRDEQIGRAAANGFVTQVAVHSGQYVTQGQLLVVISDEHLLLRREQMNDDLMLALSRHRQMSRKGELGAAEAQLEAARRLTASLRELDQALADLRVTATRSGMVVSERPEQWLGQYARRGDVLVRVADIRDKELLIVFPEDEWAGYCQAIGKNRTLTARLRGGHWLTVRPQPAQPRFRDTLPHPALAGSSGGDIPVIADPDTSGGFRSLHPLGEAFATVSATDSQRIRSGQRGRLYLSDTRSIVNRLWIFLAGS